jgi:predicted alpha/beta-hydrolase family hydrolase
MIPNLETPQLIVQQTAEKILTHLNEIERLIQTAQELEITLILIVNHKMKKSRTASRFSCLAAVYN